MSVSRLVFGTVVAVLVGAVSGCRVEASVQTKARYVAPNITRDPVDWGGGPIKIQSEGVGTSINGGVKVTADPSATKVTATARFLAMAFSDPVEADNAQKSTVEAEATFTITSSGGGVTVQCGHGGSHGSSAAGESGCELLEVTVPAGSATKPLDLTVLSGNGDLTMQLSAATISNVGANNNGSGGTNGDFPATKGATISVVSTKAGDITAKLPSTWAADEVILLADQDKIQNAFSDAKVGAGAGGRGTAGTGLKLLKLTSQDFAGSTGKVTLQ